jgi:uncharacterized protein DUF11/IPT/TIG domain-containing protein
MMIRLLKRGQTVVPRRCVSGDVDLRVLARYVFSALLAIQSVASFSLAQTPSTNVAVRPSDVATSPASPIANSPMTFTITVRNSAPGQATTVTLMDILPASFSSVSGSAPGGACSVNCAGIGSPVIVTCGMGNLFNGGSATATITATPTLAGPQTSLLSIAAREFDTDLTDNTISVVTSVSAATPTNTPTSTRTNTPTRTPTSTPTNTRTSTPPSTPTPTSTPGGPTATPTRTPTAGGATPTPTSTPTRTPTPVPGLTVSSVSPPSGNAVGGTAITVTGTGFVAGATLALGGVAATAVAVVSSTTITGTTGAHATGVVNVVVTTSGGSATLLNGYTYLAGPTLTSVSPSTGTVDGGGSVTVFGSNLSGATEVTLGGTPATIITTAATQITVTTAAHAAGVVSVQVTTPGGSASLANAYTYVARPVVTSVNPSSGSIAGGQSVTITGTDLALATFVRFGGTSATILSNTATQIIVTTPAHAAGLTYIEVNTPYGYYSIANIYTYSASFPAITDVGPNSGRTTLSQIVRIQGSGFTGATAVTFGSTPAVSFSVIDSGTIIATTPTASTMGPVNLVVTTPVGSATLVNGYTYTKNDAQFISQSVTTPMQGGTSYSVSVTMKNTGNTTWTNPGGYGLGSQTTGDPWGTTRVYLGGQESIAPQQQKTFTFNVIAPTNGSVYGFQWRMVQEFVEWFGALTPGLVVVNPAPMLFTRVAPCRVVDTRLSNGAYGTPSLAANTARTFILAGQCGIPTTAKAVSFTLTVVLPTASGYLILYPANVPIPLASFVNYDPGRVLGSNTILGLDSTGRMTVYCGQATGSTDLILDVSGYFQ